MMAGSFYLLVGVILLAFAIVLHYFTASIGYQFLAIGFFMFFIYCLGKGSIIFYISRNRYLFYKNLDTLNAGLLKEERTYTDYRINKKKQSRRIYIWATIIGCIVAFAGAFSDQKGLIMGTAIPVALIAGIEFCIGLLNEFRMKEFARSLHKKSH